jgi:four helix bundle protein
MSQIDKKLVHFRNLKVHKLAFDCAMIIFKLSECFPVEEKFSLVDQRRKSSRSVCSNIAESWRKRKYKAYFINKLTDSMGEASETQNWLDFCLACNYIDRKTFDELDHAYDQIIAMLNGMLQKADTFCY